VFPGVVRLDGFLDVFLGSPSCNCAQRPLLDFFFSLPFFNVSWFWLIFSPCGSLFGFLVFPGAWSDSFTVFKPFWGPFFFSAAPLLALWLIPSSPLDKFHPPTNSLLISSPIFFFFIKKDRFLRPVLPLPTSSFLRAGVLFGFLLLFRKERPAFFRSPGFFHRLFFLFRGLFLASAPP